MKEEDKVKTYGLRSLEFIGVKCDVSKARRRFSSRNDDSLRAEVKRRLFKLHHLRAFHHGVDTFQNCWNYRFDGLGFD